MPTRGTEQRRRCKRSIGIHRHSVKSLSRVPFKAARRFALFSIRSGIYRTHESHRENQEKITVKECEVLRNSRSSSKRERVWKIYCLPMKPTRVSFHFVRGSRYFLFKKNIYVYIYIWVCSRVRAYPVFEFRSDDKREINMQSYFLVVSIRSHRLPYRSSFHDENTDREQSVGKRLDHLRFLAITDCSEKSKPY